MQATRLWRLACLLVLGSAALASCGKDEAEAPSITPGGGGAGAGSSGGSTSTPTAGDDSGAQGGRAGSAAAGSTSTTGGTQPAGGSATAGAHSVEEAGAGGALGGTGSGGSGSTTPPGEQLVLCTRITNKVGHADAQARAFAKAVFADCRIKWVIPLGEDLDEYRQQLVVWSLEFWGCQGNPVADFGLVWGTPALSAGDAKLLIDLYLTTVNAELELSTDERTEMKAALDRLAEQLISSPSEEPSQSSCVSNNGGTAGAAGTGGSP